MKPYSLKNRRYMLVSTIAIIGLWWIAAVIVDSSIKIPSPYETIQAIIRIVSDEHFFIQLFNSLKRILFGFSMAFFFGLTLGMVSGFFDTVYYLLKPIVLIQRAIPTMAVILLSLIWLNRELSPILVGVLVIFPIIYSAVVNGIREIDKNLLEMADIYHLSFKSRLRHLYLPSIRTSLASVSAVALSLNIKISIAAEVLSQPKYAIGTGFQMERVSLNTAGVLAWSFIAILIAGLLEWLLTKLLLRYNYNGRK